MCHRIIPNLTTFIRANSYRNTPAQPCRLSRKRPTVSNSFPSVSVEGPEWESLTSRLYVSLVSLGVTLFSIRGGSGAGYLYLQFELSLTLRTFLAATVVVPGPDAFLSCLVALLYHFSSKPWHPDYLFSVCSTLISDTPV